MKRIKKVDWSAVKKKSLTTGAKLVRTKSALEAQAPEEEPVPTRSRLSRCLTTLDLISLGVGSCVGTGMYLVSGLVARKFAGPGVVVSFFFAAIASIFSGACYAEFGVRVPHTTGSAYMYSYVTVGEFVAFIIGWNMILEYVIGTSACARALSACLNTLSNGAINNYMLATFGTVFGKPPDVLACVITLIMTAILVAGVKKSMLFNNVLNAINLVVWVFIMGAGMFYVDFDNWNLHDGFLPFGWSGVFSGAATCFYAFIGFDIIATTGEEAQNPKRSIPLSIVMSLVIILCAYVTSSMMLTLIVPYDQVDTESALVQMFAHVDAPVCKFVVAIGALAGLSVSMFGSMFPLPRVMFAMAQDGLIFRPLSNVSETTGTPALATVLGGCVAAVVALLVQLEILVEMMSIGTLLAYTLVSTCVLGLRYQAHYSNMIELLPQSRTPVGEMDGAQRDTGFGKDMAGAQARDQQRVMVRRVTRGSPDSDDTLPGDESEEFGRDDTFLVSDRSENKFYGSLPGAGGSGSTSACSRFFNAFCAKARALSYLCPGIFPWVDPGPATENSGYYVVKAIGVLYGLIIMFDMFAAYGSPGDSTFTNVMMTLLFIAIIVLLLLVSRKPQNHQNLMYTTPGLPFVPAVAILVNVYLILNLSYLTLVRFTIWMALGLVVYFKYGIKNSTLELAPAPAPAPPPPPQPGVLDRKTLPPPSPRQNRPNHDRNIFEGDDGLNQGFYGTDGYSDPLLAWHEADLHVAPSSRSAGPYVQVEQRYNQRTNATSTHTASSRPPWAYPDKPAQPALPPPPVLPARSQPPIFDYDSWDD